MQRIVGRHLLGHERKQNGAAKNDGSGTEAGISVADEHQPYSGGRTYGNLRDGVILDHTFRKEFHLVGIQIQREWEARG